MAIRFYSRIAKYGELSNFAPYPMHIDGARWPTVEHYFQAQKFEDADYRETIRQAKTPAGAKKLGRTRKPPLRTDWEDARDDIMRRAVLTKFTEHDDLADLLLSTGEEELIEAAPSDYYWGEGADGTGQNKLGKILERVREDLRKKRTD